MTRRKTVIRTIFFISFVMGLAFLRAASAHSSELEGVNVKNEPCTVLITLTEKAPYKVVQFDNREILVAFRDVELAETFARKGLGGSFIHDVSVAQTQKGVVSIVITTNRDVDSLSSKWAGDGKTLAIVPVWSVKKTTVVKPLLAQKHKVPTKKPRTSKMNRTHGTVKEAKTNHSGSAEEVVSHKPVEGHEAAEIHTARHESPSDAKSGNEVNPHAAENDQVHSVAKNAHGVESHESHKADSIKHEGMPNQEKKAVPQYDSEHDKALFQGLKKNESGKLKTSDDLYLELEPRGCEDHPDILKARGYAEKGKWSDALSILNNYANDPKLQPACREYVMLFKAQCYFKEIEESDQEQKDYVKAADHFQDMISYYPESAYVAYALTSLGKIYLLMGDHNQAEGYFHIVKNTYKDSYPGIPEIMFELGWIYTEKNNTQLAIDTLKDVVARFPSGSFIGKAKLKLGKALFNTGDFHAAIRIFEELIAEKPQMVFQSSELLFYLGNAYYLTGKFEKAMVTLLKVYNLYPEIEDRDTLLTRIGDIMLEMKNKDQAVKIFKLVTKKFPKTNGFVISTMRLAEYLDNPEEKEKMYTMVITEYPKNPLAQLAMMRLALLQNQAKQYEKSIETVKALLAFKPKELQKDAVHLIQDSSGYIFKKLLETDDTTELISRYETDRKYLDDMESPAIFFSVGKAYLKSHLFESAVATLQKAYNRTGERRRTRELIHALGVSMDEAGRDDEALELYANYLKRFPGGPETAEVCSRMGQIFFEKKQHSKAIASLRKAYERTGDAKNRVRILSDIAKNNSELGDYGTAVATLENAAALLSNDPEGYAEILSPVYKNLAENHMKLKQWGKAASVLSKAVETSTVPSELTEIYFLLGETYQHMKKNDEATSSYTYVVDNGDSFWSGMARERLRIMNLKDKLDKNY